MPRNKVVCGILLVGLTLTFWARNSSATPILSIEPPSLLVERGDSFSLDVRISGVTDTDLFAFQFDLAFDPLILSARSITEGPFLPSGGATAFIAGTVDNTAGTITGTADTLIGAIPGVNGSGVLAFVDFEALSLGTSPITFSNEFLLDSDLHQFPITGIVDGVVGVFVIEAILIPEPSTWLLLSTAGFGLLIWRYCCRKKPGQVQSLHSVGGQAHPRR
jgi:adhesin HecA-like repeat protein